jgi:WD40 repeat protein
LAEQADRVRQAIDQARTALAQGKPAAAFNQVASARKEPGHERNSELLELWREVGLQGRCKGLRGAWRVRQLRVGNSYGSLPGVSISPDGRWAACGSDKVWDFCLWDLTTGELLRKFEPNESTGWMRTVVICPDSRTALSGRDRGDLLLWDLTTGGRLRTLQGHKKNVGGLSITPDGRRALSCAGQEVRFWDLDLGRCLHVLPGSSTANDVTAVSISPDGRWGLSCCYNDPLRLWDLVHGKRVRALEGHTGWVTSVCMSPDGRRALSGSEDKTVRLWELATGRCLRTLEGHTAAVTCVTFSPDSQWAFSASEDKTIRIWDLVAAQCVRTLEGHTKEVRWLSLTPDGHWLLSGSKDDTLCLWELDWEYEIPEPANWDEGARPYLETFLTLHTPYCRTLVDKIFHRPPLSRRGRSAWTEEDYKGLLERLGHAGYGWLRSAGVHRELETMARTWQGPPPLANA